jgi:hypothetical protein
MPPAPYLHSLFLWEPLHEGPGTRAGVVVKRTYDLVSGEPLRPSEAPYPLFEGDVYFGKPGQTALQHERDGVPLKPLTDVVVNARAWARRGTTTREATAAVQIGTQRKEVLVLGDRYVQQRPNMDPFFSEPRPFESIWVRWEYAYGGTDPKGPEGQPMPYPRNPLGMGIAFRNPALTVDGMALPNIEDPRDRLTPDRYVIDPMRWEEAVKPTGLGWVPRTFWDRRNLSGLPESMRALWDRLYNRRRDGSTVERKPFPAFDLQFWNGAAPGLAVPRLAGNELIHLERLDPDGDFDVVLPGVAPTVAIEKEGDAGAGKSIDVEMPLTTVAIQKEERLVYLVWGGVPRIDREPTGSPPPDFDKLRVRLGERKVR